MKKAKIYSNIIFTILFIGIFIASDAFANNFGPKPSAVKKISEEKNIAHKKADMSGSVFPIDAFIVEVIPDKKFIKNGETISFEYWIYVSVGANFEGLSKQFSVNGQIVNLLLKRSDGTMIKSDEAYVGAPFFFDEQKKKMISKQEPLPDSPTFGLIKRNDMLEAVNGEPVSDLDTLMKIYRTLKVGEPARFSVIRDSSKQDLIIVPRKFSSDSNVYDQSETVSLNVIADFNNNTNMLVVRTGASLEAGDVISAVDGVKMQSLNQWYNIASNATEGKEYLFSIVRNSKELNIPIKATKQVVSISAEYVYPKTGPEVLRSETKLHGKKYVKARPLVVNVRFDTQGKFIVNPGCIRMRGDIAKPGLFALTAPKPIFSDQPNDLSTDPIEITVS